MSSDIFRWLSNLDSRVGRLETAETISPGSPAGAHTVLSATHSDTLVAAVVRGDLAIGNDTPKWARLAITVPAANICNYLGVNNAETKPSWKSASSAPGASAAILASSASGYLQLVRLGAGVAPSYPLHALATSTQLRLSYDGSYQADFAVGSAGLLTITPSDEVKVATNANDWKGLEVGNANAGTTAAGRMRVTSDRTSAQNQVMMGLFGSGNTQTYFGLTMADYAVLLSSGSLNSGLIIGTASADPLILGTNNVVRMTITSAGDVGIPTAAPASRLDIGAGALTMAEMTAPGAPAANSCVIYAEDNGAGKTRLMALFPSGVAQQITIEP